ncbi:hypothetical protein Pcinc_005819 [Petrolisthes cinctipes]|uniref:Uncharacterized protein n=1 Tax=Petrolisthes cinctipes TaxID=88211 RepID=A0AAE1L290_PETCI|nr:hypothetical protein Pcinc_005819 [Petrolisthes cinctipes]
MTSLSCSAIVTAANLGSIESGNHGSVGPIMSDRKYTQHFRPLWESDSRFKGWLQPYPGDSTKARCKVCNTTLQAHLKTILGHASTKKHVETMKSSGSKVQTTIRERLHCVQNDQRE